ncbi:hypothetical protein [Sulfobacillus harzensis]|uniref:Uncharacterized protein n=1 Tax=Sulfobacillus harzensis TaxID=2729629 RepID=A0A7Y0L5R0_9FIRM|nr:hypothetical protein [Sulfobacillus harzensis]NMP23798.1 hypothetical protein [Sulfobacillus harzensis]
MARHSRVGAPGASRPHRGSQRTHWRLAPWAQELYGTVGLLILALLLMYILLGAF